MPVRLMDGAVVIVGIHATARCYCPMLLPDAVAAAAAMLLLFTRWSELCGPTLRTYSDSQPPPLVGERVVEMKKEKIPRQQRTVQTVLCMLELGTHRR